MTSKHKKPNYHFTHFKNIKNNQLVTITLITNAQEPNLCPVQAMHTYVQMFKLRGNRESHDWRLTLQPFNIFLTIKELDASAIFRIL
jgi:hypothetical protein